MNDPNMDHVSYGAALGDAIERYLEKKKLWEESRLPGLEFDLQQAAEALYVTFVLTPIDPEVNEKPTAGGITCTMCGAEDVWQEEIEECAEEFCPLKELIEYG